MNAVCLTDVGLTYGKTVVLEAINLSIPTGVMMGFIGPDGVGKSSLLALISGARKLQSGSIEVLGGSMAERKHRDRVCPHIAYMPQGLGKNLYPTLSVEENLQFFGRLFGHGAPQRRARIDELTRSTGLYPFLNRPAGNLSGGMKQKLGLCCALIHDPQLLILDEPTTGVDPLSRSQFWDLIDRIRRDRPQMSVLAATAYMDEAARFDRLAVMDVGRILTSGTAEALYEATGTASLEAAFIRLLPEEKRRRHQEVVVPPLQQKEGRIAIQAENLTMRFGSFTAVDGVSFEIRQGEIFGFLGSNGCGKTTTMKMLTGLLTPSTGTALLFGEPIDADGVDARRRVGYMSQSFSLYNELTVSQNLVLHARLFGVEESAVGDRVSLMMERFGLLDAPDALPENLPLGMRQRLSLAVAMVHGPELLILDEPTSGVDPVARDNFWRLMIDLARNDGVTIFISTHFMNEGARCDRISLMHAGRVLDSDTPENLVKKKNTPDLESAFIEYLRAAGAEEPHEQISPGKPTEQTPPAAASAFSPARLFSYALREGLELARDPLRGTMALLGSLILMLFLGYGISMDVKDLRFAVLDREQTSLSRDYALNLSGSRYFIEQPPVADYDELDRRMRSGELSLVLEIPTGFGRDFYRNRPVTIGAWIDGAMPQRAETVQGYVQGMHLHWLGVQSRWATGGGLSASAAAVETRFRYNPDIESLPAMVPAVIPLLLLMLPAMLTALSVVREKELGSIINLYVTPVTRAEFLLGKQLPYVALAMISYLLMVLLAVTLFGVPITGSFWTLTLAAFIFVFFATGMGLLASTFTRSQVAAIFFSMVAAVFPAIQFGGLTNPVSAMEGVARIIGEGYPVSHFVTVSRGVFNKALDMTDLYASFWPMILAVPVVIGLSIALLRKQER